MSSKHVWRWQSIYKYGNAKKAKMLPSGIKYYSSTLLLVAEPQ